MASGQRFFINYEPTEPQEQFAEAIKGGARVVLFLGGIRSGKTVAGIAECLKQIYVYQSKPSLGYIVSPTYPMSVVPDRLFRQMCQTDQGSLILKEERGNRAYLMRPPSNNPCLHYRVEIKTGEQPDRLRGSSIAWALLDEAAIMDPEVFTIIQGRVMDNGGLILITTTPKQKNWLYEKVYLKSLEDPRYVTIKCKTASNFYLPPDEVENLYRDYTLQSANLAKREMDAEFVGFEGLVFDRYQQHTHTVPSSDLPDIDQVYCGIDWGYNDPFVCVWVGKKDGVWVVLDEYYKSHTDLESHAAYLKSHPLASKVKQYWADPSDPQNRREFLKYGIHVMPARRPKSAAKTHWNVMRARLINTLFGLRLKRWDGRMSPGMVFSDRIRHGTREMQSICYENTFEQANDGTVRVYNKDEKAVDRNASEKITPFNDHFTDALGYVMFSVAKPSGGLAPHYYDAGQGKVVEPETPKTKEQLCREEWANLIKRADAGEFDKKIPLVDWTEDPLKGLTEPQE